MNDNIVSMFGDRQPQYAEAWEDIYDHIVERCDGMPLVAVLGMIDLVKLKILKEAQAELPKGFD